MRFRHRSFAECLTLALGTIRRVEHLWTCIVGSLLPSRHAGCSDQHAVGREWRRTLPFPAVCLSLILCRRRLGSYEGRPRRFGSGLPGWSREQVGPREPIFQHRPKLACLDCSVLERNQTGPVYLPFPEWHEALLSNAERRLAVGRIRSGLRPAVGAFLRPRPRDSHADSHLLNTRKSVVLRRGNELLAEPADSWHVG
jgi:hypothetical protein